MTLAALLDLGIDQDFFLNELKKLDLDGYEIVIQKKQRHSIAMLDVDVILENHGHSHHHGHFHHHEHSHDHIHPIKNKAGNQERNLNIINKIIDDSEIGQRAKDISKEIFKEIAEAEAKVHGKSIEDVHFHEVGAVDSIVDIVGVAICIDYLNVDTIYSSPLHDGHGFIQCQHGLLPVPVPAVMAMLEDSQIPVVQEDVNTEMITPTGMGIVKCIAEDFICMPSMKIEKTGYGLGKRDTGRFGAVRAILGTAF